MPRHLRAVLFAVALTAGAPAAATVVSTNYSDLWWNPLESGWGANITQQDDLLFVTFFVYGTNGQAVWYTGTLAYAGAGINGNKSFTGDLYQTNGPWLGGPFDPSNVTYRLVGTATFASNASSTAVLQYSVDGQVVTKGIQRQTLTSDHVDGTYLGILSDVTSACADGSRNGTRTDSVGTVTITQAGTSVGISAPTCNFNGAYTQEGQFGRVAGSFGCTDGTSGPFTFFELRSEQNGLFGRYTRQDANCSFSGTIAAVRRTS
jgi:hypothetical protein